MNRNIRNAKKSPTNVVKTIEMEDSAIYEFGAYETPKGVENEKEGYIQYGDKNDHYNYLDKLYEESPTNNACVNANISLIRGKGICIENESENLQAFKILRSLMKKGEWKQVVEEYYKYGECMLKVVVAKGNNRGKKTKESLHALRYFPVKTTRPEPKNDDGDIPGYKYSPDWKEHKEGEDELEILPAYGTENYKKTKTSKQQWLKIMNKTSGQEYFGLPRYNGALNWADLEVQIADFALTEIDTGFSPGYVVNFPGQGRTQEAKSQLNSQVQNKLTGSRGQRVITGFFDDSDDMVKVEAIPQIDNTAKIAANVEVAEKNIYKGHRLPPAIVGDYTGDGGLNFADKGSELETASKWVIANVTDEIQTELTDEIEMIFEDFDMMVNVYVKQKDFLWKPLEKESGAEAEAVDEEAPKQEDPAPEEMWKEEAEEIQQKGGINIMDRFE